MAPEHVIRLVVPIEQAIEPSIHHILTHPKYSLEALRTQGMKWRDHMMPQLTTHCSDVLRFERLEGGMRVWAEVAEHVNLTTRMPRLAPYWNICRPGYFYFPGMRGGERNLCFSYEACEPSYVSSVIKSIADVLH